MQSTDFLLDFVDEKIYVQTITFGNSIYIFIGPNAKNFSDLSFSMPSNSVTHLIGDTPSDELAVFLTQILKQPVLLSYNYQLESENDLKRFEFVKIKLRKHYLGK
ncbi:hypothetical protein TVAG_444430 [Trichomonas vaginalis G3]|uniref:Uncharacterized protein n=1 Tax=Trichomonas vaginalis (strain ATCC PRA-98 / G3) TaxID=412133 RepID=A2E2I4_TRIV3|nr:hypothetical protein TVAGG3_0306200 [Trichomonas vaginalis G3]EAY13159.1 hypothetical protein TVAG_444430 [Trichomonas vaginalis G3]KAI5528272.1 hypothetical protein TVAGG3_0306200 [Trichomonas vaginalis G3]|eukprot:XP_001325382.1 hypothetical protein [Trichomonas vaginalis G3]